MHRSVTHLPRSANTQGSRFRSHLFNPSARRLAMSCWLRKYKPRAAFWSLSAALFCQAEAFLSSDTKCSLSFSPWELHMLPPTAAPAFVSPREQGSWQDARVSGRETALRGPVAHHHMHAKDLGRGGSGEFRAGEWQRSPVWMNGKDLCIAPEQSKSADPTCSRLRVDAPVLGTDLLRDCWETVYENGKAAVRTTFKGNTCCFLTLSNLSGFNLETDRKAKGLSDQVRTSTAAT